MFLGMGWRGGGYGREGGEARMGCRMEKRPRFAGLAVGILAILSCPLNPMPPFFK